MISAAPVIEFDDSTGIPRRLWRAKPFADHHPQLGTYHALRKRIERRHSNGLLECGAVVESRVGFLIDRERYFGWLLKPNTRQTREAVTP